MLENHHGVRKGMRKMKENIRKLMKRMTTRNAVGEIGMQEQER